MGKENIHTMSTTTITQLREKILAHKQKKENFEEGESQYRGQGSGQGNGQGQGSGHGQGSGQGSGQGNKQGQGQGQGQGNGNKQGQGQGQGNGNKQGQGQGRIQKMSGSGIQNQIENYDNENMRIGKDPLRQSTTIFIPEVEKRKHQNKMKIMNRKDLKVKESSGERNDFLLDISSSNLNCFDATLYHLYPMNDFTLLCVLILRNNQLSNITEMNLTEMSHLTDLDLSYNLFSGSLPSNCFPQSIERLDLSNNQFDNLSRLIGYNSLLNINISYNKLKTIPMFPSQINILDLSYNLLSSAIHLRLLSFSPSIIKLYIIGNPIVSTSSLCKTIIVSVLPNIKQIDGINLPRKNNTKILKNYNDKNDKNRNINQNKANESIVRKVQVKADEVRTQEYAKKIKANNISRNNIDNEILLLARPMKIGPQATELLVRRLTWVPPYKGVGAEFFNLSVDNQYYSTYSTGYSDSRNRDVEDGRECNHEDDETYKYNNENKNKNENECTGISLINNVDKNIFDDQSFVQIETETVISESSKSYLSLPSSRKSSRILFSPNFNRSASASKWRSQLNHQTPRYKLNDSNNGNNGKKNRRNSHSSSCNTSEKSEKLKMRDDISTNSGGTCTVRSKQDSKAFSSFGTTRNVVLTRTNSAPNVMQNCTDSVRESSSVEGGKYKPFARHTDIPLSPSRDRKAAGKEYRKSKLIRDNHY